MVFSKFYLVGKIHVDSCFMLIMLCNMHKEIKYGETELSIFSSMGKDKDKCPKILKLIN